MSFTLFAQKAWSRARYNLLSKGDGNGNDNGNGNGNGDAQSKVTDGCLLNIGAKAGGA